MVSELSLTGDLTEQHIYRDSLAAWPKVKTNRVRTAHASPALPSHCSGYAGSAGSAGVILLLSNLKNIERKTLFIYSTFLLMSIYVYTFIYIIQIYVGYRYDSL